MSLINRIEVENFKSLVDFQIDLAQFSCLIGMNGSGKSTVLQFIDFLSQLVRGDMNVWLKERKWNSVDLKSKLSKKVYVEFRISLVNLEGKAVGEWEATYNPNKNRCIRERINFLDSSMEIKKDHVEIRTQGMAREKPLEIAFDYEGSILSALREEILPPPIIEFKKHIVEIRSLDLLAPEYLRQRTREAGGTLGLGGQNLSSFLHEMSELDLHVLVERLKLAYPHLQGLHARPLRSGWKQLEINESYGGPGDGVMPSMTTEARHMNDGMLRLIAILAELQSDHDFLLFDEIENGINPELIEFVLRELVRTPKQIIVTTHSPMILNYLEDDTARKGVLYLYKNRKGHTRSIQFFSIPSLAEKLTVMGPGEAFVDTDLVTLVDEIEALTETP